MSDADRSEGHSDIDIDEINDVLLKNLESDVFNMQNEVKQKDSEMRVRNECECVGGSRFFIRDFWKSFKNVSMQKKILNLQRYRNKEKRIDSFNCLGGRGVPGNH